MLINLRETKSQCHWAGLSEVKNNRVNNMLTPFFVNSFDFIAYSNLYLLFLKWNTVILTAGWPQAVGLVETEKTILQDLADRETWSGWLNEAQL